MSATILRPYQREAIDATYDAWSRGILRPALNLPTGSGKTTIFAWLIVRHFRSGGRKVIVIAHRRGLVSQAAAAIRKALEEANLPHLRVGLVMGSADDTDADVIVASIATLARSPKRIDDIDASGGVDLVVYDELHHSVAPSSLAVLKRLGVFTSVRFLGVTATLERGDHVGLGAVVQHVAYSRDIEWMIKNRYLVRPVTATITATNPASLAAAYRRAAGARQGIVFTRSLKDAEAITRAFNAAGLVAAMVDGGMPDKAREDIYDGVTERRIQILVNVGIATEGFDLPQLEVVVLDRNVGAHGLYLQIVGRVLRLSPGKTSALVLLVVGGALRGQGQPLAPVSDLSRGTVPQRAARGAKRPKRAARPKPVKYRLKITTTMFGRHVGTLTGDGHVVATFKGSEASVRGEAQAWAQAH